MNIGSMAFGMSADLYALSFILVCGWMATVTFAIFGRELYKTTPVFWFMMQIAMLAGFLTSYPFNWYLLRRGIKEEM